MDPLPAPFLALIAAALARVWLAYDARELERRRAIERGEIVEPGPVGWVDPTRGVKVWRWWAILGAGLVAYAVLYRVSFLLGL